VELEKNINIARFILALQKTNSLKSDMITGFTQDPKFTDVNSISEANDFLSYKNDHFTRASNKDWYYADSIIEKSIKENIFIIPISTGVYPSLLKFIHNFWDWP